jgi:hypothetical protein
MTSTPGFLVNRVLMPYLLEAVELENEGIPPAEIVGQNKYDIWGTLRGRLGSNRARDSDGGGNGAQAGQTKKLTAGMTTVRGGHTHGQSPVAMKPDAAFEPPRERSLGMVVPNMAGKPEQRLCAALPRNEPARGSAGFGGGPGLLRQKSRSKRADMAGNIVEVVEMSLFFVDDCLKELHADAVAVLTTHEQELVVYIDGVIFQLCIERENLFHAMQEIEQCLSAMTS